MLPAINNVLLVRTDRLGDVILSTPVATALKRRFPDCRVTFLARRDTSEILECHPHVDEIVAADDSQFAGRGGFFKLANHLRGKKFDTMILLHPTFALALLMLLARIPQRIGTGYRFYSLLFTDRVFEHRKTAFYHEAEYNLRLLRSIGIDDAAVEFHYELSDTDRSRSETKLSSLGIAPGARPVILHVGSGGSSRDWPLENFAVLADALNGSDHQPIVFSGLHQEIDLVEIVAAKMRTKPLNLAGRLTLKDFALLLEHAAVFVSNSTGPLHLAVMVGTPVVAFYPPIRVCRPERWGPYGRRADVLMSQQEECRRCRKSSDRYCACMAAISVEQAFYKICEKLITRQVASTT